ncbi:MAG TPA: carboxypeptidase-like regulatory domain-containing protein [Verrucomicrobiae bacterium]
MATSHALCRAVLLFLTFASAALHLPAQSSIAERLESVVIRVIDSKSQQPLETELKVSMCDDKSCFPIGKFNTDAFGMHIIKLRENTKGLTVWVSRRGYVPKVVHWTEYHKDLIPPEYTVKLETAVTIGGAIRDEQGNAIPDAQIAIQGPGSQPNSVEDLGLQGNFQTEITDAAGQWTCHAIPAKFEVLTFHVTHPDFAPASFKFQKELWRFKVTVPEIPTGRTEEPLDIGIIEFKPFPPRQPRNPAPITSS